MTAVEPGVEVPLRADQERAESVPGGGGGRQINEEKDKRKILPGDRNT